MISVNDVQAAFVQSLKSDPLITGALSNNDIREDFFQGKDFVYPNLRVDVGDLIPVPAQPCDVINFSNVTIWVYGELDSSYKVNDIAALIANKYHEHNFTTSGHTYRTTVTRIVAAKRTDERTWRAGVILSGGVK